MGKTDNDTVDRNQQTLEKLVRTASGWWLKKVCNRQPHSNGDDSKPSVIGCMMADFMSKPVSVEQALAFSDALDEEIWNMMETGGQTQFLSCDYGPDIHLANAAEKAGINVLNFPFKTNMRIDFEAMKIFVSDGYGMTYTELKVEAESSLVIGNIPHHGNNNTRR